MAVPRTNVASWVRSGRSVAQGAIDVFETARESAPDYTGIVKAGQKSRAQQKKSAMDANARVVRAEDDAETKKELTEIEIKTEAAKRAARGQQAKGQALAKAGSLLGAAFSKDPDPIKPIDPSKRFTAEEDYLEKLKQRYGEEGSTLTPEDIAPAKFIPGRDYSPFSRVAPEASQQTGGVTQMAGGVAAAGSLTPEKSSSIVESMGFTPSQFNIFKQEISKIESGGRYNIAGGSNKHYDGKYQLGAAAKTDGARYAGIADPGHGSASREAFRNNPQLQEQLFEGFTKANHTYLMGNPTYRNSSKERQLEILGYAHNQGMGGAEKWMTTGRVGYDGFGTAGTKYTDAIASRFRELNS